MKVFVAFVVVGLALVIVGIVLMVQDNRYAGAAFGLAGGLSAGFSLWMLIRSAQQKNDQTP